MAISRCPHWSCAKCQSVHGKKDLAETIRRLRGRHIEEELSGHVSCSKCGARHAKADVYGGKYDVRDDQSDGQEELAEVELLDEDAPRDERRPADAITADPPPRGRRRSDRRERDREPDRDDKRNAEVEEARDAIERKRHKGGSRRQELGWVNVGLAIHYGGMIAFLLAIAAGWLALFLMVIAVAKLSALPRDATPSASLLGTLAASGILFVISNCLSGCSSLTDFVSSIFCLRVPDSTARGFLIGALCTRLLAFPLGLALMFFVHYGLAVLSSMALAIIGWGLWVVFLHNLALCLKQPVLAQESIDITFSAVKLGLAWVFGMGTLIGLVFLMVFMARVGGCFMGFFIATFIGATVGIIRYLVLTDRFGSLTNLVLYPTGIPLIMRYLDLIGSLRMVILRRA